MGDFIEIEVYTQLARVGKALANPVRLRLLDLLERGESDVDSLAETAGVSLKNTSAQLRQLRDANLVRSRRQGTHIYYSLAGPEVSQLLGTLQSCAETRLADLRLAVGDLLGDPESLRPVTVEELQSHLDDPGVLVLDVRPARDYARGHVPGAVSLPAAEISEKMGGIPRDVEIIAYCDGPYCVLSPDAVRSLRRSGLSARPLDGGMTRWQRAGMRIATGDEDGPAAP
ncbi:metalloregulator ArsR/SmtB family transcription factor [Streptomyces boncukensis]|uniref:Metalloregulator ArsR/SmtB family transcription factor n=1 Tax=Streptomyces boncukensis TaxID=2711219 RepID=A0A6G4WTK5_9ACTN|nr:metalloregulator ArsR/SmtB family transcription factor [Streptomyces boncukensis]